MRKRIQKIIATQKAGDNYGIVLRKRRMLYSTVIAASLFGCTLLLLFVLDIFFPAGKVEAELSNSLVRYEDHLSTYFSNTAGRGILLARLAAKEVERTLAEHQATFADVSNNSALINALERNTVDMLRNAMLMTDCSGAFIIFDATVNTALPGSENSRAGVFLKLANINVSKPINPDILWIRGTHEVGLANKLLFHNKWELEFSVQRTPFYRTVLDNAKNPTQGYYYSPALRLHGTWERIMVLFVPIVGKDGAVYGVCGFEISAIFFKLMQPVNEDPGRRLAGLVAQKQGDVILPGSGLESGTAAGYFAELGGEKLRIGKLGNLNVFTLEDGREFVGGYKEVTLSPLAGANGDAWVIACFMPKEDYSGVISAGYMKAALYYIVFLGLATGLCWYINRRNIAPLLAGIAAVKSGAASKTNIHEIDDLLEFLDRQDALKNGSNADIDMSAFYAFKENISTLSKAEKSVFNLYMEGHAAPEIADALNISINTVKTHNKNIYRKLNVTSREVLLVYAQMMRAGQA